MTTNPRVVPASARMPLWVKLLLGLLAAVVLLAIIAGFTAVFGLVQGTEFSPQIFHQRSYHYWQIPVLGVKVSPIHRDDTTGPLIDHLIAKKYLPTVNQPTAWDLVTEQVGTGPQRINDAQILIDYLQMEDPGGYLVWLRWSEDHPEYAQAFWPVVAHVVRHNLYVHLPQFFRLARSAKDAPQFAADLQSAELKLYRDLADRWQRRGRSDLAKLHYEAALAIAPNDPDLQSKVKELAAPK